MSCIVTDDRTTKEDRIFILIADGAKLIVASVVTLLCIAAVYCCVLIFFGSLFYTDAEIIAFREAIL